MADESKPLDGKTTFDDKVIFEAQRLSYDAARVIAEKIAKRISGRTKDHAVVIAGTQFLADLSSLAATAEVLVELEQDYHAFAHPAQSMTRSVSRGESNAGFHAALIPPVLPILSAATAAAQGALSLVSLFRQDVDYKGVPVSIDTVAFEIELAARVRMHKAREVIVPDLVVFRKPSSAPGSLKTLLEHVKKARAAAVTALDQSAMDEHHVAKRESLITRSTGDEIDREETTPEVTKKPKPIAKTEAEQKSDPVSKALSPLDQRFNDLQSQLTKADASGSGLTTLARLFRVESIMTHDPMILHARVVLAGGNNRVQHSLWSLMWSGDGLSSSGGAVVNWAILSPRGAVEDGAVFSHSMSAKSTKPPEAAPNIL